jgi:hypothetical protein
VERTAAGATTAEATIETSEMGLVRIYSSVFGNVSQVH